MFRCGYCILGIQLVTFASVNSFMVFTANFDDIKRIAQNFVPDSITNKICSLLTKVKNDYINDKISKENEANYDDVDKIAHHKHKGDGKLKKSRNKKYQNTEKSDNSDESISNENVYFDAVDLDDKKRIRKTRFEAKSLRNRGSKTIDDIKRIAQNILPDAITYKIYSILTTVTNDKILEENESKGLRNRESIKSIKDKPIFNKAYAKKYNDGFDKVASTNGYVEEEDNKDDSINEINELNDESKRKNYKDVTSRDKDRNEFDQINFKSKPVATSGFIALPRLLDTRKSIYRSEAVM